MEVIETSISKIKPNPDNPRIIKDANFERLVKSIKEFPEMLNIRPIVCNSDMIVLGGNMRLKACKEAGLKKIPVIIADSLTEEQQREFIIKDNVSGGEWDWDMLTSNWDVEQLNDWGIDLPNKEEKTLLDDIGEKVNNKWVPDCLFASDNEYEIPCLKLEMAASHLELPFMPYGAEARSSKGVNTYHFYVDDYRFESIWDNPNKIIDSGCKAIVEPNLSLYDTTPISYGMHLIYKKRWFARFMQENDIKVYVDLNVSIKFQKYNTLGIPKGYNAFFTRGYGERLEYLISEIEIAKQISGVDKPNIIVYGGGQKIKKHCQENEILYVEQLRGFGKNNKTAETEENRTI